MRKFIISLFCLAGITMTVHAQDKTLTILHTNDTHSCVLPMSENLADTLVAGRGGFLRRITMLKEERMKDPDLLYIDSGDFFQGSPFYTMFKGDVEIGLMNEMGITATTIGNHEWDFGIETFADNIRMANFPFISSNYDFTGTELEGLIKPYIIVKKKGVKIGILAVGPKLSGLVAKSNFGTVVYNDPVKCAFEVSEMLRKKEKCDLIICISHLGWSEEGDMAMIQGSKNIDMVLGGHSHTYFEDLRYVENLDGKPVPVDQNGKSGIFVGKMVVDLTKNK